MNKIKFKLYRTAVAVWLIYLALPGHAQQKDFKKSLHLGVSTFSAEYRPGQKEDSRLDFLILPQASDFNLEGFKTGLDYQYPFFNTPITAIASVQYQKEAIKLNPVLEYKHPVIGQPERETDTISYNAEVAFQYLNLNYCLAYTFDIGSRIKVGPYLGISIRIQTENSLVHHESQDSIAPSFTLFNNFYDHYRVLFFSPVAGINTDFLALPKWSIRLSCDFSYERRVADRFMSLDHINFIGFSPWLKIGYHW